ncbi:DNL zinc finger-domain-containing protein [Panaeolus papilionaceus]|nr:DNL zinc finger-domain-containing protein [Panaeolus papilionaceus]
MLPTRLFRNTGIPPVLRSLVSPHPKLPPSVSVPLRFKLGIVPGSYARLSSTTASSSSSASASSSSASSSIPSSSSESLDSPPVSGKEAEPTVTSQQLPGRIEPRLSITFTCTVPDCNERSTHEFSKRSYEKGIVLVQCPGCKNRHLIADHLGWFKDSTDGGKLKTVEDLLASKGEKIKKGRMGEGGVIEFTD